MTPEKIRELTNHFCHMVKKYLRSPEELRGKCVVLSRVEGGWDLTTVTKPFNRRNYVAVVDLPDDLFEESLDDAIIDLAGLISRKLTDSARAINSQRKREKKQIVENAKKAAAARWQKKD
ncbi:hypothetical protein IJH89_01290 [Candidatus Saccharibacteria bacterium]|nr:hypothetical protein [Candidatus Saccharibacteria bacterium]